MQWHRPLGVFIGFLAAGFTVLPFFEATFHFDTPIGGVIIFWSFVFTLFFTFAAQALRTIEDQLSQKVDMQLFQKIEKQLFRIERRPVSGLETFDHSTG